MEVYCMKCKSKIIGVDMKESLTKNKRKIFKGFCPKCKGKVCRIGG